WWSMTGLNPLPARKISCKPGDSGNPASAGTGRANAGSERRGTASLVERKRMPHSDRTDQHETHRRQKATNTLRSCQLVLPHGTPITVIGGIIALVWRSSGDDVPRIVED